MDSIGKRLATEYERSGPTARASDDALVGAVMRGARVRRARRVAVTAAAIVAVGLGMSALVTAVGDGLSTPEPGESPQPTADGPGVDDGFSIPTVPPLPGGIDADEYPAVAADRGDGFPTAYRMEEWVWDRVGTGWGLALVAATVSSAANEPRPVFYLVSPEGAAFELTELPAAAADNAAVVTWHEDAREARIVWGDGTEGALVDLDTGALDPIRFTQNGVPATWVRFVASDPHGNEVWAGGNPAWAGEKRRNYLWTPEQGWTRILRGREDLEWSPVAQSTSPAGEVVVYTLAAQGEPFASAESGPAGQPHFYQYFVSDDQGQELRPAYPPGTDCSDYFTWQGNSAIVLRCEDASGEYGLRIDATDGTTSRVDALETRDEWVRASDISQAGMTSVAASGALALRVELRAAGALEIKVPASAFDESGTALVTDVRLIDPRLGTGIVRLKLGSEAYVYIDAATGANRVIELGGAAGLRVTVAWYREAGEPRAGQIDGNAN